MPDEVRRVLKVVSPLSQVVVWPLVFVLSAGGIYARVPACCLRTDASDRPACCLHGEASAPADEQSDSCCPSERREPVRLPDCNCELAPLESLWASLQSWDIHTHVGQPIVAFDGGALDATGHNPLLEHLAARSPQVPLRVLFCTWLI